MDRSSKGKPGKIDTLIIKTDKVLNSMARRTLEQYSASKKRHVFDQWRIVARRQRIFYRNLSRVCVRSFYAEAFARIKDEYRANSKEHIKVKVLSRFFRQFGHDHLKQVMSRWKLYAFKVVYDAEAVAKEEFDVTVYNQKVKMSAITHQNVTNVEKFFRKKRKQRVLAEWLRTRYDRVAR